MFETHAVEKSQFDIRIKQAADFQLFLLNNHSLLSTFLLQNIIIIIKNLKITTAIFRNPEKLS